MQDANASASIKQQAQAYFRQLQDEICAALEKVDGKASFVEDRWVHGTGGDGRTRVLQNGGLFEKASVNYSAVTSELNEKLAERMQVQPQDVFATGISLVLHPHSPMVPTVHLNLRYLELANGDAWFGGGTDLTPYYLFDEDARHFHRTLKAICDKYQPTWYTYFKQWCDNYFYIKHRKEARGVGGIFFDYQREDLETIFCFVQELGFAFLQAYLPIVERRQNEPWGERENEWQLIRRGRYVEFNLVYDRGTLFGLETGGRIESILMSLPPEVKWVYDFQVEPHSREEELLKVVQKPREWV